VSAGIATATTLPYVVDHGQQSRAVVAQSWGFHSLGAAFRYRQYPNSAQLTACASGHQRTGRQRVRSAGVAAVRLTAEKLRPDNDEQAEDVALVISQVFSEPVSDAPLAGQATLLEALQAGIAWQLARLGDPSLTGTGMFCRSARQEASA
jgi:hypothetical protein